MYNHYLDNDSFVLLDPEPQGAPNQHPQNQPRRGPQNQGQGQNHSGGPRPGNQYRPPEPFRPKNDLVGEVARGLGQVLDGVMKHFSLEHFDTGDILLVLIILFLYLEDGDNLELVITLGLLLLLGLDDDRKKETPGE